jgi:hypothetical protein
MLRLTGVEFSGIRVPLLELLRDARSCYWILSTLASYLPDHP